MGTFQTFDRDLVLATGHMAQEEISRELARFAKAELAKAIASGQGTAHYTRYVGGIEGAAEETVDAPGPILYRFAWWGVVVAAALAELVKRSPVRSGIYSRSFIVLADQQRVTKFDAIPAEAEVIIFNAQPYTRKIEVGAMQMSVPDWHFFEARKAMTRRFGANGAFRFESRFLTIGGGIDPRVPYRLKRSSGRRRDRQAGSPLAYPALIMNLV